MNFGHYSCITKKDLLTISNKKSLWGCYSGTLKRYINKLDNIPCIRGERYVQPSKMSFLKLALHAFSILAVFKTQVFIRSGLYFIVLFFFLPNPYSYLLSFLLILFTGCVFYASRRESAIELSNCLRQIDNIQNIHTKRL